MVLTSCEFKEMIIKEWFKLRKRIIEKIMSKKKITEVKKNLVKKKVKSNRRRKREYKINR